MRTALKISTILSWVNLVVWGLIVLGGVIIGLLFQQLAFFIIAFLLCVNILHSYAAIQLHRSIKDPSKPLSNQTPAGIRFIGMIAAFLGIVYFAEGTAILQNPKEAQQILVAQIPWIKDIALAGVRLIGSWFVILGVCLVVNVLLNFRLLRWYHFMKGMM